MRLTPNSDSLPNEFDAGDVYEANLREVGWTDASRAAALESRLRNMSAGLRAPSKGPYTRAMADMARDHATQNLLNTFGSKATEAIKANLGVRIGVSTKSAPTIRSTFWSNDGKHMYIGHIRGMRQKILSWAKANRKQLPSGFENRAPTAIAGMFRGMARGGYFGGKKVSQVASRRYAAMAGSPSTI